LRPTVPRLMRLPLIAVLILAFMLLPADLMAIICHSADAVTFKVLDAARYYSSDITSLEIEIIASTDNDIFFPGRHFNVEVTLSPESRIKIGQTLKADFISYWNLPNQLVAHFNPDAVVIVDDHPSCVKVREPFFEYQPIAFILFWWLIVILLVSKKKIV